MSSVTPEAICNICQKNTTPRGIGRHLSSCLSKNMSRIADQKKNNPGVLHLKVQEIYKGSPYWLHLAVNRDLELVVVDSFLRKIWLECCGHMSAFFEGSAFASEELDMGIEVGEVLAPKQSLSYIYDFGSETNLIITCLGQYPGKIKERKITLLARNPDPEIICDVCEQQVAKFICHESLTGYGEGFLCPRCLEKHKCEEGMLLPVVNSPRTGVCGYEG